MKLFTKYIPVNEAEYLKFKEHQNRQARATQEELGRAAAVVPLSNAQNEKSQVLFTPTTNVELQEKRYTQLFNIVNDLKKQVEADQQQQQQLPKATPRPPPPPPPPPLKQDSKADAVLNALGDATWNDNGELVIDNEAIPSSNKAELMKFATSNWRTKYLNNEPVGSAPLLNLMKTKKIPGHLYGKQVREKMQVKKQQPTAGLAIFKAKKKKKPVGSITLQRRIVGEQILEDDRAFKKLMSARID